ncbi:MAG: hypothetical protein WD689_00445 [Gaiellaceae bacterium]
MPTLFRLRCARCGYGVSVASAPERCPMCGGEAWDHEAAAPADASVEKRRGVRATNERIRLLVQAFDGSAEFVCECADEDCFELVTMSADEWRAATVEGAYFVVRPTHVALGEQAVIATERYAVVRAARRGEPAAS